MEDNYELVENEMNEDNNSNILYIDNQISERHSKIPETQIKTIDSNKMKDIKEINNNHNSNNSSSYFNSIQQKISKKHSIDSCSIENPYNISKAKTINYLNTTDKNYISSPMKKQNLVQNTDIKGLTVGDTTKGIAFGERLYRKAVAIKEVKENKNKIEKEKQEEEFKKRCSFKPQLNEASYTMSLKNKYGLNSNNQNTNFSTHYKTMSENSSPNITQRNKKTIESYFKKKEEEDLKELRPSIKKSQKQVDEIATKLYIEAERLKVTREKEKDLFFSKEYTFTPSVTDVSTPKIENFYKRLQVWIEKRNQNYAKDIKNSNKDPKTGQVFFKPHISRKNSNVVKSQARNIFIDLYEETKKFETNKKDAVDKQTEEIKSMANLKKATQQSDDIHNQLKDECFNKLFDIISNSENVISNSEDLKRNVDSLISLEIRDIMEPLFTEFIQHNHTINNNEFLHAIEHLYKFLNVEQKRRLLDWYSTNFKRENSPRKRRLLNNSNNQFTFKPSISENSYQIYEMSQRYSKDIFERNNEFLKKKDDYIQSALEQKLTDEVKGCTFRPTLDNTPSKK